MIEIKFDLRLLDQFKSKDESLMQQCEAVERELFSLRARFEKLVSQLIQQRIESLGAEREAAALAAKAVQEEQEAQAYKLAEITAAYNYAEKHLAECRSQLHALRNNPINPNVSSRQQIEAFQKEMEDAIAQHNRAVDAYHKANMNLRSWEYDKDELGKRRNQAEEGVERIQYQLDVLTNKRKPKSFVDAETGLPV